LKSSALIGSELSHGGSSALLEKESGNTAIHAPGGGPDHKISFVP
jgi:hypothetical protein